MKSAFIKTSFASIAGALAMQAGAAQARVQYICPELDTASNRLSVNVKSGCMSSSTSYIANDLAVEVDQQRAHITITGDIEFGGGGRIVTADCMGAQSITLTADGIEARRYTVSYGDSYIGLANLLDDPAPKQCLQTDQAKLAYRYPTIHKTEFRDWSTDLFPGHKEWRSATPMDLVSKVLGTFPETDEGKFDMELSFKKMMWAGWPAQRTLPPHEPFLAVRIERHGLLDDSVSGDRYFIAMRFDGEWKIEQLWGQSMCGRGDNAGQWTGKPCL